MGSLYARSRRVRQNSGSASRQERRRVPGHLSQPLPRSRAQRVKLRFSRALNRLFTWRGWPTLVSVATAVAAIAALFFTSQSLNANSNQYHLAQRGQVSERFGKAVEQLGSEQQELRLGGIYSLEQLARDSPDDHWTAFEVLVAFVRSHAPLDERCVPADKVPGEVAAISIDLQAVLTVVGRRAWEKDRGLVDLARTCLVDADLSSSHLAFAYLYNANLTGANLIDADLSDANLTGADLTGAELTGASLAETDLNLAHLSVARLWEADLTGANLTGADLADADLVDATLTGADLTGADLAGADLHGTDLTGARLRDANLTGAQLNSANLIGVTLAGAVLTGVTLDGALYDSTTSWPEGFTPPR